MIGPGPGYRAWEAALDRLAPATRPAGDRRPVRPRRGPLPGPLAGPRRRPTPAGGRRHGDQQRLDRPARRGRPRAVPAGRRHRGGDRPDPRRPWPARVDLLKIAHHGSRTSSTGPFLDAVRPRVAVASAGKGNPYGHPTKATLDRVAARGAEVLRTDRNGSVEVTFDGATELDVRPERSDPAASAADDPPTVALPLTAGRLHRPRPTAPRLHLRDPGLERLTASGWPDEAGRPSPSGGSPVSSERCPFPTGWPPPRSSSSSIRRRGRSATPGPWPRSPPGWPRGSTHRGTPVDRRLVEAAALLHDVDKLLPAGRSGARPPPRRRLGRLADGARPPRARAGRRRTPGDPAGRRAPLPDMGRRSPAARSGSSPTPTSGPGSASSRWTPGSRRGRGATRSPLGRRRRPGGSAPGPSASRPTSVAPPGCAPDELRRLRWTGPALRAARTLEAGRAARPTARIGRPPDDAFAEGVRPGGPARLLLRRRRLVARARRRGPRPTGRR